MSFLIGIVVIICVVVGIITYKQTEVRELPKMYAKKLESNVEVDFSVVLTNLELTNKIRGKWVIKK